MANNYDLIHQAYQNSAGDSTPLFQTLLSVANDIGLDQALAYLERCVTEKRLAWLRTNLAHLDRMGDPLLDGYRIFYEVYLGVSVPGDGEIVARSERKLLTRWWNRCPTLDACQKLGLDTREICMKAYHKPVQAFLTMIDPRLSFHRNYEAIRPHQASCEEMISLAEN